MAATYDPTQTKAKDRVRRLMGDVAVTFQFQDEEIGYELTESGFLGDPLAVLPQQATPELLAAIGLLESVPGLSNAETTVRQGSVSRTFKGAGDRTAILASLKRRYAILMGAGAGIFSATPEYPGLDPRRGYPNYGE